MAEFSQEVKKDFDRQMGCMAGMFQIFDRRRLLTGRQRGGSPGTGNELPSGTSYSCTSASVLLQPLFFQRECLLQVKEAFRKQAELCHI
jgi:hypothetical protein